MSLLRVGALLSLSAFALAWPAEAEAQSLSETVGIAISTSPRVAGVAQNRQTTDSELRRARGLYLPQADARIDIGPEYSNNSFTRSANNSRHLRQEFSAVLTQRLYDGGEADGTVEQQKARSRSSAFRVRETAEFVGLDAVEAHLDVLRLRRILKAADENLAALRALERRVRQRTEGGAGRSAEIAQALARVEQAQADREETQGRLREVEARYRSVVGTPPASLIEASIPVDKVPRDVEASVTLLQSGNPTVKITEADIDAAKAQIDVADARFVPTVNLELSGSHNRDVSGFPGTDDEARALLVLHWNLYAGGADVANRDAAYSHYLESMTSRLQALRQAEENIRTAWASYDSSQRRARILAQAVRHNVEVHAAYDEQYNLGTRSLLDLLDSQQELFASQTRLATAEEAAIFAAYRILALDGMLLSSLNVRPPVEADPGHKVPRPAPRANAPQ